LGTERYTYDPLGRITAHLDPQGQLTHYLHDPAGDRLRTRVRAQAVAQLGEDTLPRAPAWQREGHYQGADYRFDRAGNLTERRDERGTLTLRWDSHQRLVQSTLSASARDTLTPTQSPLTPAPALTTHYHYDPLGRRLAKRTGAQCTAFFWDGDALLADVSLRVELDAEEGDTAAAAAAAAAAIAKAARRSGEDREAHAGDHVKATGQLGGYRAARATAFEPGRLRQWVYLPDSFEPLALQVGMLAQSPSPIGMGEVGGEGRGEGLAALAQARAAVLVTEDIDQGVGRNGERGNQRYGSQPQDTTYSASASLDTHQPVTALHSGEYVERSALASASASLSLYWYQNDPNGCPVRLLSSTGEVLWAASYTAWADLDLLHAAAIDNPIRLQGQYADPETGLYYNRHRYFCPHAGQFVSKDPIAIDGGLNIYSNGQNSLSWIDPTGLTSVQPYDIVTYGTKQSGLEMHHGILDVWASHNVPGYVSRASHNPAIALSTDEHSATKKAYRDWLEEKTGKRVGGVIDWSKISKAEIKKLSERMFDEAKVPKAVRKNYYAAFNKYLKKGCKP
jgi:RHS repeat-associated protein